MSLMFEKQPFAVRGFNLCESILRHTPEQLRKFIRRMKVLRMNTLIVHSDYGWNRRKELMIGECRNAGVDIVLMVFGPRTFFSNVPWKTQYFAKDDNGRPFSLKPECETHPCTFDEEGKEAFYCGAVKWLEELPEAVKKVHLRAADGNMFCRCQHCRTLTPWEKWQSFVELFAQAAEKVRPDLQWETDIYFKRYDLPEDTAVFDKMHRMMYDTFGRHPSVELGSRKDEIHLDVMSALTEKKYPGLTPNSYHLQQLKMWAERFPGKVYIHENSMMQRQQGIFQYGTSAYLRDLEIFRELGISGVCYEAFEPGYCGYEKMFEILGKALCGEEPEFIPGELDKLLPEKMMEVFCCDRDFPLEKFVHDPFELALMEHYRLVYWEPGAENCRKFIDFAFANPEKCDMLNIGYGTLRTGMLMGKIKFSGLSESAEDLINRRKLWDFMEEIPPESDPVDVCRELIRELAEKAEDIS